MQYFPLFLDLNDVPVLVVGGGDIARRKIDLLQRAGAAITVVAPSLHDALHAQYQKKQINWINETFYQTHVHAARLVIAATGDAQVNAEVAQAAKKAGVLVNVVDDGQQSDTIFPAIVDRSPLVVAISSSGASPVVTRLVREKIEQLLSPAWGALTLLLQNTRTQIKERWPNTGERRRQLDQILQQRILPKLDANLPSEAAGELAYALAACAANDSAEIQTQKGRVILVGAGPGDAGLLTLNGLRALQQADVIVHDRLVSNEVLELARRDADKIAVGKEGGQSHSARQDDINQLLVDKAKQGLVVVRLKGGDAFVFGRGGEELQVLRKENIDYEVVPGITAALGCAAYSGIPLTHRDHAQAVSFITACNQHGERDDWQHYAQTNHTLAIYMGVKEAGNVAKGLIAAGRSASTPVAIIENGSREQQRILRSELHSLAAIIHEFSARSPSLVIIGEVAALSDELHWFGSAPQILNSAQVKAA